MPPTKEATRTPWKQSGPYIIGQNLSVAKCTVYKGTNEAKDIENENQAKANAAFIVTACNAYAPMVEALRDIVDKLDELDDKERIKLLGVQSIYTKAKDILGGNTNV